MRVLNKRIFRDLRENFLRYLALFLMIVMGMYLIVSMVGAAETIICGTADKAKENRTEDGQFAVFLPLSEEQEREITDSGVSLEKLFSFDLDMEDNSVLRVFRVREEIDLLDIDGGTLPQKSGEIALEKRYCDEHEISVGDKIVLSGKEYTVTAIGSVPDYDAATRNMSDGSVESSLFGVGFVVGEDYDRLKAGGKTEDMRYAYRLNGSVSHDELKDILSGFEIDYTDIEDEYFKEYVAQKTASREELQAGIAELKNGADSLVNSLENAGVTQGELYSGAAALANGMAQLQSETNSLLDEIFTVDIDNLTEFIKAEDNPRIAAAAGDMQMDKSVGLIAGVIVMALFTYVISVFVIHQIQRESGVIGALYALGAKKRDLIGHYITLPTLISFAGGLVGSALGFSDVGIPVQVADSYAYFSLPQLSAAYPLYLIIYGVIMPPAVCALVNVLFINKRLSRTALSLMRNEQNTTRRSGVNLKNMGFLRRFQIRQMLREARTGLTIVFGMTISLMVFMMALNCFVLCNNIKNDTIRDTTYENMYTLKYPPEEVPQGAEACYAESLTKSAFGYTLDVSVIGVDSDNKYYGVTPEKGKSKITASASAAQKYGLKVGDKLLLTDSAEGMDYAFTVTDIADYSAGLCVFMDIDSMRELFGRGDDYYNMLLSDKALDIPEGRIYSVTGRSDTERSAAVFTDLMMPMVIMLSVVSTIIFCVVMYLMMNVMIDRASFGISLVKIFGYRTKEVRKLYLNGNTIVVALGALIAIPVSKLAMDAIYPYAVSNVACGLNIAFPWYYYVLIFAAIMLIYFAVNALLVRKLKNISPAEVLKNRE